MPYQPVFQISDRKEILSSQISWDDTRLGFTPPGGIIAFGGSAAPVGWLLCNGANVSRTTYANLFKAIGTTYGAGDGSTTFGLPNLQQRFPLGKATSGTGATLGGTGGTVDHTHTQPTHTHTVDPPNTTSSSDSHSHTVDIAAFNSGGPNDTDLANVGGGGQFAYPHPTHIHSINPPNTATSSDAHTHTTNIASFNSGADGNDATGTANPPFQVVNYIIRI